MRLINSWVWGKERMYLATLGWRPVRGRNSGTKCGLGRKRTSNTRSASSGTPCLKPKLTHETRMFLSLDWFWKRSARWARDWWTLNFEGSTTHSAHTGMGPGRRRSALSEDRTGESAPNGGGRRVSLKRRISEASEASR